jgi:hypothetical protein
LIAGCDIEKNIEENVDAIRLALYPKELAPCSEKQLQYHLLWSAHESLSKALRLGFLLDLKILKILEICKVESENGVYIIDFVNFTALRACTIEHRAEVICVVIPKRLKFDLDIFKKILNNN